MESKTPDPAKKSLEPKTPSCVAVETQQHNCDQCDESFKSVYALTSHKRKVHKLIQQFDGANYDVCDDSGEETTIEAKKKTINEI